MRPIDDVSRAALTGSRPADTLTAWAWRDGRLVLPEQLQIISWSLDDEAGDSVKVGQKVSLTIADPDGTLGAWRFEDPLSAAGTELHLIYQIGGAGALNYGRYRITGNTPDPVVNSRIINEYGYAAPDSPVEPHKRRKYVTAGTVTLDAVDITAGLDRDDFEAPESAKQQTVLGEFARLTSRYFPTVVDHGVLDAKVPRTTVYDRKRLEACQDLLSRVGARYRMGGDGECHIYPVRSAPVWRVEPGQGLVSVDRSQSSDGIYNRWIVEGKDGGNGKPVRAAVSLDTGVLRYGGAYGRAPFTYTSETIETTGQALAYAIQLREEFLASLAVVLTVETVPRPELQAGDWIEVGCPVVEGHVAYLPGQISAIRRSGAAVPEGTTLTVSCAYNSLTEALNRTEWAQHITEGKPLLTWDRMPGNWGQLPAIIWDNL